MSKISVIMLVYNREKFVARAIESILNQTFIDFEFIIIDNGSSDRSGDICDSYIKTDDRVNVIHKPKGNIGSGRNAGIDEASSPYVMFVDDDDLAEPDMLEFLYNLITSYDADISLCGSYKNISDQKMENFVFDEILVMKAEEAVVELLKRKKYNVAMPTKLFKKEILRKERFLEVGKYDDITVGYKYLALAKKVVAHGKPKYTFFRHSGNNSDFTTNPSLLNPYQLDEYFEAFKERTIYCGQVLPKIGEFVQYTEWSYMISMCNKIVSNKLENCSEQLDHIIKTLTRNYSEFYNSQYLEGFEKDWIDKYIKKC